MDGADRRRRERDHGLPDHAVHRFHGPVDREHGLDRDGLHVLRPHERDGLHVHRRRGQRRRRRHGVGGLGSGDAGRPTGQPDRAREPEPGHDELAVHARPQGRAPRDRGLRQPDEHQQGRPGPVHGQPLVERAVHDGHLPDGLVRGHRRPADAARRPAERRPAADLPHGHDAERPELRSHRVQLDAELHADRAGHVDDRPVPREAEAAGRPAARELHDVHPARRLEQRSGRLLDGRHDLAGLQLLGRRREQQRRLRPLLALQRRLRRQHRPAGVHGLVRPPVPGRGLDRRRRPVLQLGLPAGQVHGVEGLRHDVRHVDRPRDEPEPAQRSPRLRQHRPRRVLLGRHAHDDHERGCRGRRPGAVQREQLLLPDRLVGRRGRHGEPAHPRGQERAARLDDVRVAAAAVAADAPGESRSAA